MKYLIIIISILAGAFFVSAQTVVMLHKTNGTQQAFYSNNALVDAYNAAAVSGDTIYLPGGGFAPPGTFDKGVIIYGVGHYPDSTSATNKTVISSGFAIGGNGDRFHLEGVQVNGGINTTYDQAVDYIVLKRNYIIGTIDIQGTNTANPSRFMLIEGNVITGQIVATNGQQVLVTSNITMSNLVNFNGCVMRNNVFLYESGSSSGSTYVLVACNNNVLENNVFYYTFTYGISGIQTFSKNVFFVPAPNLGASVDINNFKGTDRTTFFVTNNGSPFTYLQNYHLSNAGNFAGTDGKQVGIYGGSFPYKEGAVPSPPHVRSKTIASSTDGQGKLNVQITTTAQDK
jgi:hypothetical protein